MSEQTALRVLLIEDDDEDAAIFCRYAERLREHEIAMVRVAGEEEGWRRLLGERFDIIFLDLNLTGGSTGIDVLKRLRRDGIDIPVIVVTGTGDEVKAVESMKGGAYDYVLKERLNSDLLERAIRHARKRHSLEQERVSMVEKLAELSVTDELTGLANRRLLEARLQEETARSQRTGRPFVLLMIDLDHFKRVNDRYGHQKGDEVLRECAAALRGNVRKTDFVGRYGGEEFCVLLPETPLAGARVAAEKLRQAAKALPEPVPTVSIGVACWQPRNTADEIIERADQALYEAKKAGRDRVVVYGNGRPGIVSTSCN